jgi:hypothetical protein
MSHFSEVAVDFLSKNETCLVEALEAIYGKGNVEQSNEGLALYGYGGDDRSKLPRGNANYAPKCNVVVRRKHVGGASNDIGYYRTEDGKYKLCVSDYDSRGNFGTKKQNLVKQNYTASITKKQLKSQGYTVQMSKNKDGTLKISASKFSK